MDRDIRTHCYLRAKIQLFPYLPHIDFSFERKPMVIHGGEVFMNSHEMGSHMLMTKSPFLQAPNRIQVSERNFIIIQVRAWPEHGVNSVNQNMYAGTINDHKWLTAKLAISSGGCCHEQHRPTQDHSSTEGKSHLQCSVSAGGCRSQCRAARTCEILYGRNVHPIPPNERSELSLPSQKASCPERTWLWPTQGPPYVPAEATEFRKYILPQRDL